MNGKTGLFYDDGKTYHSIGHIFDEVIQDIEPAKQDKHHYYDFTPKTFRMEFVDALNWPMEKLLFARPQGRLCSPYSVRNMLRAGNVRQLEYETRTEPRQQPYRPFEEFYREMIDRIQLAIYNHQIKEMLNE